MEIDGLTWMTNLTGYPVAVASLAFPRGADMLPWVLLFVVAQFFLPRSRTDSDTARFDSIARVIGFLAGVWLVAVSVYFLIDAKSVVDGVDLAFFVNYGRDWAWGYDESSPTRYAYFPGAYVLWAAVVSTFGASDSVVQATVVWVLLANAFLVGCLTHVLSRSTISGVLAGATYLAVAARYEAFHGTTEPIATIPFLGGVIAWQLLGRTGRPFWAATGLGVGIGLALFCKQQAGLLSLGAIWLLTAATPDQRADLADEGRKESTIGGRFCELVVATAVSSVTFLIAVLCLGDGLLPVITGLTTASQYGVQGDWTANLAWIFQSDRSFLVMVVVSVGLIAVKNLPNRRAIGMLVVAGLMTFVQFKARGFAHYTLLAIPCFTVAFVSGVVQLWDRKAISEYRSRVKNVALLALLLLPAAYVRPDPAVLALLRVWEPVIIDHEFVVWHQQPEIADAIEEAKARISRRDSAVVLPSRRGVLYRKLEAVCPAGYRFNTAETIDDNALEKMTHVVVLADSLCDDQERETIDSCHWLTHVEASGSFTKVQDGAFTIFSRSDF